MRIRCSLQGRTLSAADLTQIRAWRAEHPSWHRTRLSRELCTLWGWRNAVGQLNEHNFGHGKKHLAALLLTLNILAFLFHTVLGFTDERYRLVRAALPTRHTFFQHVSALTHYLHFPSWDGLLRFMMRGLEIGPYAKPT